LSGSTPSAFCGFPLAPSSSRHEAAEPEELGGDAVHVEAVDEDRPRGLVLLVRRKEELDVHAGLETKTRVGRRV
jgi:hypothetical protein